MGWKFVVFTLFLYIFIFYRKDLLNGIIKFFKFFYSKKNIYGEIIDLKEEDAFYCISYCSISDDFYPRYPAYFINLKEYILKIKEKTGNIIKINISKEKFEILKSQMTANKKNICIPCIRCMWEYSYEDPKPILLV